MTRKLFGTDGIRGRANQEPMTAETTLRVALAAGSLFKRGEHRHRVVIGKDTRLSGYMLEPALTAGFIAKGMDVILLGPLPTPAVAMLTKSLRADLGVMISASHNPYQDNGIKRNRGADRSLRRQRRARRFGAARSVGAREPARRRHRPLCRIRQSDVPFRPAPRWTQDRGRLRERRFL
jgi:phosphomannomutase